MSRSLLARGGPTLSQTCLLDQLFSLFLSLPVHYKIRCDTRQSATRAHFPFSCFRGTEESAVGAIGVVTGREDETFFDERPGRVFFQQFLHKLRVFLRFDGAGGVHETSARFDGLHGVRSNSKLHVSQFLQLGGRETPAHINAALHDPGVAAWDIRKHGVEGRQAGLRAAERPVAELDLGRSGVMLCYTADK